MSQRSLACLYRNIDSWGTSFIDSPAFNVACAVVIKTGGKIKILPLWENVGIRKDCLIRSIIYVREITARFSLKLPRRRRNFTSKSFNATKWIITREFIYSIFIFSFLDKDHLNFSFSLNNFLYSFQLVKSFSRYSYSFPPRYPRIPSTMRAQFPRSFFSRQT